MKKLMIAVSAAVLAVAAQAASIDWGSGAVYAPGADGKFTDTLIPGNFELVDGQQTYTMTVIALADLDAFNSIKLDYDTLSKMSGAPVQPDFSFMGATYTQEDVGDGKPYYAAVLFTLDEDGDGKADWYIANKSIATTDAVGGGASITDLGVNIGGTGDNAGAAFTGWTATSAVPEPTSGLLLLLGVAGLALRRRRA